MDRLHDEERTIYERMPIAMAVYALDENDHVVCLCVSDGMCDFCQRKREDLVRLLNEGMFSLVHPQDAGMLARIGSQFAHHQCGYDVVYRLKTWASDEHYRYVHTIGGWQKTPDGREMALLVYNNVDSTISAAQNLVQQYEKYEKDYFYTDILTGLPNENFMRAFGNEKMAQCFLDGGSAACWYIDVNGMHAYNSRYGLQEGDKLLIAVGRALGDAFCDGLVCRSTDDHFLVIAPYHKEKTDEMLRQINARVQQCVSGVSLGVRAGICEAKPHMPVMEVLDNAHTALKQIGTNLNVAYRLYSSDTEKKIMLAHQLVTTFEQALERHWIVPYYQLVMGVSSGKIAHAEALARWNDPVDGLLQPGQFIPVLRNFHLLYKLDLSILRQVCHMLKSRLDEGKPVVPVSVNFSRQDFDRPDLVDMINEIVDTSHLDHHWICIEITEQDISEAPERMKSQIDAIHQSGYALWMDDFGSGYSSLNVMSEYPFDLIKFDQQLLMHLDEGHGANRYIMDAMAAIARKLGIHTLAEGVEKQSDYRFLKQIGCEYAQGYLFYHPMTADEFDTVLKGQK